MLAVVEIQNRRATGFAVVADTDSWGECAVDAKQCAVGRHYAVPTLYMLFVCTDDSSEFKARAPDLIRAAAQARGVKANQLAFRGPLDGDYWQVVKTHFHRYGRVRIAGSVNPYR